MGENMFKKAMLILLWGSVVLATDCYTDCKDRFPKWYQEPDRLRCAAEKSKACLKSSGLPGPVSLGEYDSRFADFSRRLERDFLEGGYVVSRNRHGEPMHQGDSLLWTSLAMASLSCHDAAPIRHALINSIRRNGGRILRFDPLPNDCKGNETSRDAEIGALFGFTIHSLRCPEAKTELAEAWRLHYDFVKSHGGRLHEGSNTNFMMNPALNFVWDLVSHYFLGTARPSNTSLALFESCQSSKSP